MIRRWTPKRNGGLTVCAMCGMLGRNPNAHHWLESRRFSLTESFNLCPVHHPGESDCHAEAHTKKGREQCANSVFLVWGQGDRRAGREMIVEAVAERNHRKSPEIPEVSEDEKVLKVCRRVAVRMGLEMI